MRGSEKRGSASGDSEGKVVRWLKISVVPAGGQKKKKKKKKTKAND